MYRLEILTLGGGSQSMVGLLELYLLLASVCGSKPTMEKKEMLYPYVYLL